MVAISNYKAFCGYSSVGEGLGKVESHKNRLNKFGFLDLKTCYENGVFYFQIRP